MSYNLSIHSFQRGSDMSIKRIYACIFLLLATACGSELPLSQLSFTETSSRGTLEGRKSIVSAKVDYLIDFNDNSISFDGKAKALGASFDIVYLFYASDNLLYTDKMLAAGVGYRETLEGDEGFQAEITNIGSKYITITVFGESSTIKIYSNKNKNRLNIDKSNVEVTRPLNVSLDLLPVK